MTSRHRAHGSDAATVMVLAKAPAPGRSKTRLCPPLLPTEAAAVAAAALTDTLDAVARCRARRRVLVLDGSSACWARPGFDVLSQRGNGLDERLESAHTDVGDGPTFLIGMDTPQLGAHDIDAALDALGRPGVDAVLGVADDGGWWGIGLRTPRPGLFLGVPMSADHTGRAQLARLRGHGLAVRPLPRRRDVDRWDDARAVAREAPGTRFARLVQELGG